MRIVLLPGDGIGPEVAAEARRALERLAPELELEERPFGAAAIRASGTPLPAADARRMPGCGRGAEGADRRPGVRRGRRAARAGAARAAKALDVYANLRPGAGAGGVDLLIVRELVGGLYFGAKGTRADGTVFDTCEYHPRQVERLVRRGFELARGRRRRLTSVDKANVLETSRMWRRVVDEVAADYPDVAVEHMLVDNAAMQIVRAPGPSTSS